MTSNTTAQHDCADRGCQATMLGLELGDAAEANREPNAAE
jgi:hypothetical protein